MHSLRPAQLGRAPGVRALAAVVSMVAALGVAAWPWGAAAGAASQGQATERVTIRADKTVSYDTKGQMMSLDGNVVIRVSDVVMTATSAQVDVGRRVATLTGSVRLAQQDTVVTGDKMVVTLDEKKALVEGNVTMTVSYGSQQRSAQTQGPGPAQKQPSEAASPPVVVTCLRLEVSTSKREAVASGAVSVTRGDTSAKAERAVFRDADKAVVLTGSVVATRAGKETLTCGTMTFYTDRDLLVAHGEVEITFEVEKRE